MARGRRGRDSGARAGAGAGSTIIVSLLILLHEGAGDGVGETGSRMEASNGGVPATSRYRSTLREWRRLGTWVWTWAWV